MSILHAYPSFAFPTGSTWLLYTGKELKETSATYYYTLKQSVECHALMLASES